LLENRIDKSTSTRFNLVAMFRRFVLWKRNIRNLTRYFLYLDYLLVLMSFLFFLIFWIKNQKKQTSPHTWTGGGVLFFLENFQEKKESPS